MENQTNKELFNKKCERALYSLWGFGFVGMATAATLLDGSYLAKPPTTPTVVSAYHNVEKDLWKLKCKSSYEGILINGEKIITLERKVSDTTKSPEYKKYQQELHQYTNRHHTIENKTYTLLFLLSLLSAGAGLVPMALHKGSNTTN